MSINTANFLGRYAIAQSNLPEENTSPPTTGASTKLIKKLKKQIKIVRAPAVPAVIESAMQRLIGITKGVDHTLISANTVFPFILFPDTVTIDRQKVTITHRSFFRTASTNSVQIDDVQIVKVDVGPFFGSVHLASKYFADNIQTISYLKRTDALAIQRLLQGYMIAHHRKIDCTSIDNAQLVTLLNRLGQSIGT